MFDPVKTSPKWLALAAALAVVGAGAVTYVSAPEPVAPSVVESAAPLAGEVDAESLPIGSCGEDCAHR